MTNAYHQPLEVQIPELSRPGLANTADMENPFQTAIRIVGRWIELARQRRQLRALDAGQLNDIGVSREAALTESRRPFWDDPFGYRLTGIRARNYYRDVYDRQVRPGLES